MENVFFFFFQSSTCDIRPDHLNRAASSRGRAYSGSFFLTCSILSNSHGELDSSIIQDIITLRDAGRASMVYFCFNSRTSTSKNHKTYFLPFSFRFSARSDTRYDILSRNDSPSLLYRHVVFWIRGLFASSSLSYFLYPRFDISNCSPSPTPTPCHRPTRNHIGHSQFLVDSRTRPWFFFFFFFLLSFFL